MTSPSRSRSQASARRLLLAALVLVLVPARAAAQGPSVVVRILDGARIVRLDPSTSVETRLYEAQLSEAWLHDISVAPSGKYVAVIETIRGHVSGNEYDRLPRNRVLVLDTTGKVIEAIEHDVRLFTWCCGGGRLAFITGTYHEGGVGFVPDSVYLADVERKSTRSVPFPKAPTEISWAGFDSSVYVSVPAPRDSAEVWRYHVPTGQLSLTPYRGLLFSPSGANYLQYSLGLLRRAGWHIIERASGREVPLPDTSLGAVQGWVFGTGDRLLLAHGRRRELGRMMPTGRQVMEATVEITGYVIYDVTSGRVVGRGAGRALEQSSASAGAVPIAKNGKVEILRGPDQ